MCWLFVPGSEDSNSASTSLNPEAVSSVTWRGKLQPLQSWQRVWKTATFLQRLFGLTSPPSTLARGVASWIASLRASRVSPSPSQASASGWQMTAGSGIQSRASFATWSPASSSWRTSQGCLLPDLDTFSGPWPRSGSLLSGECSEQAPWEPPTVGCGSSSWPTVTVNGNNNRQGGWEKSGDGLSTAAKAWHTPRGAADKMGLPRENSRDDLQAQTMTWATPIASEGGRTVPVGTTPTGRAPDGSKKTIDLQNQSLAKEASRFGHLDPEETGAQSSPGFGRLNPEFVGWLMGFPPGWTSSGPSETEWSRWLQQSRSELSRLVPDSEEAA